MGTFNKLCFSLACAPLLYSDEPWLDEEWSFHFVPSYSFNRYKEIEGADAQIRSPLHDEVLSVNLATIPSEDFQIGFKGEFSKDSALFVKNYYVYRSGALSCKKQWLSDIQGDAASFATGALLRNVSHTELKRLLSPYHSEFEIEINASFGKEWSEGYDWNFRSFASASVGIGKNGIPWGSLTGSLKSHLFSRHTLEVFAKGQRGWGDRHTVETSAFKGYGKMSHKSIDVGMEYGFCLKEWGVIKVGVKNRIFARSYPAKGRSIYVSYDLPFSLF